MYGPYVAFLGLLTCAVSWWYGASGILISVLPPPVSWCLFTGFSSVFLPVVTDLPRSLLRRPCHGKDRSFEGLFLESMVNLTCPHLSMKGYDFSARLALVRKPQPKVLPLCPHTLVSSMCSGQTDILPRRHDVETRSFWD